jgi:hypothetical protein
MEFAFSKKTTFLDKIIKWWDRGAYCHVECILDQAPDGTYTIASSEPGVGVRTLTGQRLSPADWDFVNVPKVDAAAVKLWFDEHAGEPYFWMGLFGFVVRPAVRWSKSKWFCSEACLTAAFGIQQSWRFTPTAMYEIVTLMK